MKKLRLVLLMTCVAACGDDNTPQQPDASMPDTPDTSCKVTPGAWSAPNFATNAAAALAVRAQLDMLTGTATMAGAEKMRGDMGTITIDEVADLEAVYNGGTPSLSSQVPTALDAVMDDAFAEFVAIIAAGPVDLVDDTGWNPGNDGGLFSTARDAGFNAGGIEVRQIVDKGLFVGAMFNHALKLTEGTIDEAKIDAMAAAWGSNATLDSTMRADSANYSFAMGFHAKIAKNLADAKAYAADANCTAERDAALRAFFENWEQAMFARTVFYVNKGPTGIANATTDDERASALHEVAEGLGLAFGFYGLPNPASGPFAGGVRKMSDTNIDAMLTSLGVDRTDLGASTMGPNYVDMALGGNTQPWATGVIAAENQIKTAFGLSDDDIMAYRTGGQNM
jgi:hypothetical protein